jgi:hypothetical protein
VPPALFERHSKKCTAKKCAKCEWSKRGPKRRKQCLLPDGKTTWITAAFTGRGVQKGNLKLGCVVCQKFLQNKLLVAQSQQQKKPVSAINLRFSTCLWQTYHAIIQTIYTGMVTLRLMCKQCWTGKNQSRPVAVPWLAVRPGSKSSKID